MAKTYRRQGKIAEAVKLLQAVVQSDPEQQEAYYQLFGLYKEQGQTEMARKELSIFEELKRKTADREQKVMRFDKLN